MVLINDAPVPGGLCRGQEVRNAGNATSYMQIRDGARVQLLAGAGTNRLGCFPTLRDDPRPDCLQEYARRC